VPKDLPKRKDTRREKRRYDPPLPLVAAPAGFLIFLFGRSFGFLMEGFTAHCLFPNSPIKEGKNSERLMPLKTMDSQFSQLKKTEAFTRNLGSREQ